MCSGQWFSLLLLTPLAYAVFSQRKHSSGVESYGLDSTSILGLLPLTDLNSGIAFISIYTSHCPTLGAKCSTLYVQRSGKSVELRLSVPGSWAVIVVEL